jgi:hypothetical protein
VRSQFRYDVWYTLTRDDATGFTSMAELDSGNGRVFAQYQYQRQAGTGEENRGWRHRVSPKMGAAVKFDRWWIFNRGQGTSPRSGLRWWTLQLRLAGHRRDGVVTAPVDRVCAAPSPASPAWRVPPLRLRPAGEQGPLPGVRRSGSAGRGGIGSSERMKRRLLNVLTALSLLLFAAVCVLWVHSTCSIDTLRAGGQASPGA